MTGDLILKIILSVLAIVSALVSGLLIPYLKTKIDREKRTEIMRVTEIAVRAAEQIFRPEGEQGRGKAKKAYVVNYLDSKGFKLSEEELDMIIEATVKELNVWQNEFKGA